MQLEVYLSDSWWEFAIATIAYIYNQTSVRHLKWRTPQEIFLENKPKTLHLYVFGCRAYVFLLIEVCTNKLPPHSELIILIGYEDNEYHFLCYIQGNIIFCSIHAIFNKRLFFLNILTPMQKSTNYIMSYQTKQVQRQSFQYLTLLKKMDLLQYLFHTHLFLSSKTIFLLILLHLLFLISLLSPIYSRA